MSLMQSCVNFFQKFAHRPDNLLIEKIIKDTYIIFLQKTVHKICFLNIFD